MAQTVLITLSIAGSDTGPFSLYSNVDGYAVAFETNIPRLALEVGYLCSTVPDSADTIRVQSDNPICTNYIDLTILPSTTTTSSTSTTSTTSTTTTSPDPATSVLSYSYTGGNFTFGLTNPIITTNVVITSAQVQGSSLPACASIDNGDDITGANPLTILAGNPSGVVAGNTPMGCGVDTLQRVNSIVVNGLTKSNGQTLTIGGTLVTVSISVACESYGC